MVNAQMNRVKDEMIFDNVNLSSILQYSKSLKGFTILGGGSYRLFSFVGRTQHNYVTQNAHVLASPVLSTLKTRKMP